MPKHFYSQNKLKCAADFYQLICMNIWDIPTDIVTLQVSSLRLSARVNFQMSPQILANADASSHWLHLYDFSSEWVFKCDLKWTACTDAQDGARQSRGKILGAGRGNSWTLGIFGRGSLENFRGWGSPFGRRVSSRGGLTSWFWAQVGMKDCRFQTTGQFHPDGWLQLGQIKQLIVERNAVEVFTTAPSLIVRPLKT